MIYMLLVENHKFEKGSCDVYTIQDNILNLIGSVLCEGLDPLRVGMRYAVRKGLISQKTYDESNGQYIEKLRDNSIIQIQCV